MPPHNMNEGLGKNSNLAGERSDPNRPDVIDPSAGLDRHTTPEIEDAIITETDDHTISCATLNLLPSAFASLLRKFGQSLNRDGIHCRRNVSVSSGVKLDSRNGRSDMTRAGREPPRKTDIKVKNIYRKPACRLGNKHRSNSCSRFAGNRTNSCKLRRTVSNVCGGHHYGPEAERHLRLVQYRDGGSRAESNRGGADQESGSMEDVFRLRTCSLPDIPQSILKNKTKAFENRSTSQRDSGAAKRASFRDSVDVYYYTKEVSVPCYVSERGTKPVELPKSPKKNATSAKKPAVTLNGHAEKLDTAVISDLIKCIDTNVLPAADGHGNTFRRLHMRLAIDESCMREKTSVKALSGGKAVIVHLFPKDNAKRATSDGHLENKMPLPLQIDPYSVRARVHKDGVLTISANIPHVPLKPLESS